MKANELKKSKRRLLWELISKVLGIHGELNGNIHIIANGKSNGWSVLYAERIERLKRFAISAPNNRKSSRTTDRYFGRTISAFNNTIRFVT